MSARQRNMKTIDKSKSKKSDKFEFDGEAADLNDIFEEMETTQLLFRQPITVEPLETLPQILKHKVVKYRGKKVRAVKILAASGENLVPEQKLKVMSDPYLSTTRKDISNVAMTDPIIAPALNFRIGAHFEFGFKLKLVLASTFNTETNTELTPEEQEALLQEKQGDYLQFLRKLSTWKDDKKIVNVAKDLEGVSLPQGKAAALISPGIMDLPVGDLPFLVEIITAEDLGDPIVDVGGTRQLVGCKLMLTDKPVARADELIYMTRGIRGLRKEAKFHGTSPFEPILQISKAIKRFYNLDAPLAMIAAYITRQLLKVKQEGDQGQLNTRIQTFMTKLFKASNWAIAMPEWYDGQDTVQPKVDWPMFDGIEEKLANVELNQLGVPKSSQNREKNLNRDTATIQAIQFVRFVRNPSEEECKEVLENQLFNPLLAHLCRKNLEDIPVRIAIERNPPEGADLDTLYQDDNAQKKSEEITEGDLAQDNAPGPMGAKGAPADIQNNGK